MDGVASWSQITWVVLLIISALTLSFSAFWAIYRLIQAEGKKSRDYVSGIEQEISRAISAVNMRVSGLAAEQTTFRTHIAENYVMKDALKEVVEGNREIRDSISAIHQRLDRVMEIALLGPSATAPAPSRRAARN